MTRLLMVFALVLALTRPAAAFETTASHVYIVDVDTGAVLMDKGGEERIPTASMSKMMTAYVVFQQLKRGKIKLDDTFPVSEQAWRTGGSKMFVSLGEQVKVEDLLQGMIVQSGNDACVALAEGIAGSEQEFAGLMNEAAAQIGLKNSHFMNADGLPDPDHYMTPEDLATLGIHLIKDFPEYYHWFSQIDFTYNNIKQGNRNPLLYKNSGADGIKTGHTEEAGFSLTASVRRGDRHIIMVATGLGSKKGRSEEAERLVDYAFREFQNYKIATKGEEFGRADVAVGTAPGVALVAADDLTVTMPRASRKDMKVTIAWDGPLKAPVEAGTAVGVLTVAAPDVPERQVRLVTQSSVPRLGPLGRLEAALFGRAAS